MIALMNEGQMLNFSKVLSSLPREVLRIRNSMDRTIPTASPSSKHSKLDDHAKRKK